MQQGDNSNSEAAGSTDHHRAIVAAGEALADESIGLLKDLIVAAKHGAGAIEAVLTKAMQSAGCETETQAYDPRAVPLTDEFAAAQTAEDATQQCVIGRLKGTGDGRSLILFAHPDPEEYRPEPAWRSDPFTPLECDGRLHGWGVADDLAGLAMLVRSVAVLNAAGLHCCGDITLVSAPSKKHRRGISAALHQGLNADAAIYLHPAESGRGLDEIKAFAPGQLEFRIRIKGRQPDTSEPAHTAFAHRAVNPFQKAGLLIDALEDIDALRGDHVSHDRLQEAIGRSANLMISHCRFGSGDVLSRLPDECEIGGAMTLVPDERLADVMQAVETALLEAAGSDPWFAEHPPEIVWLSGVSAAETPSGSTLYQSVDKVLRRHGANPQVNPLHTSSDIRNPIVQKAIPTVGFGPLCGGLTMSGLADEWVDIDDTIRAISAVAEIIALWGNAHTKGEGGTAQ